LQGPAAPAPPSRGHWWRIAIVIVAGILTYANSLSGPFILDDQSTIVDNRQIREWWSPSSVLVPESDTAIAGRPIVNLTFAVNYAIGGLDVRGYHAGNIAIHVICALLAFGVIRRTLDLPRMRDRFGGSAANVACAVALLWVVHPLNSEVVDYLTERTESLMALFYLLTLYASIRAIRVPGATLAASYKPGQQDPVVLGVGAFAKTMHHGLRLSQRKGGDAVEVGVGGERQATQGGVDVGDGAGEGHRSVGGAVAGDEREARRAVEGEEAVGDANRHEQLVGV